MTQELEDEFPESLAAARPSSEAEAAGTGAPATAVANSCGDTASEAAASSIASGSTLKAANGSKTAGSAAGLVYGIRQREEDYYGVCHTDVVKCIVITEGGKIFTAG